MTAPKTTKPYRPSNGTEGDFFYADWCNRCMRDQEWREHERNPCEIFSRTLINNIGDPDYPKEWVVTADAPWEERNPRCLAFQPVGDARVPDQRQEEMPDV